MKTAIIGYGVVGSAYHKMFPDAVIYDEPKKKWVSYQGENRIAWDESDWDVELARNSVNECDVAVVSVWTGLKDDGTLDMSIVEEVVGWLETPLIIIKSALYPGTVDRLVAQTGKRIAVSVEYIGEGNYPVHFWKFPHQNDPRLHQMLVVGGQDDVAEQAAQVLWRKLSPDVRIQKVTAIEAEIVKLVENAYGALKVTFANSFLSVAEKSGTSFVRMHQAWNSDPRTDSMHLRAVSHERGWKSKCWDKDVLALVTYAKSIGANDMGELFDTVIDLNRGHIQINESRSKLG